MPINYPTIQTQVTTPNLGNPSLEAKLKAMLMGMQSGADAANQQAAIKQRGAQESAMQQAGLQQKADLEAQGAQRSRDNLAAFLQAHPKGAYRDPEGASFTPKDTTAQDLRHQDTQERNRRMAIGSMTKDYNTLAGKSPNRVIAAQAILDALQSNDTTTQGRIKAQLPLLEGENYKPTDAERDLILQATGEGAMNKLKNFLGYDTAVIGDAQKQALQKYVNERLSQEQGIVDRSRQEVQQRYGKSIRSLSPEEMDEVNSSLGMSSMTLKNDLQSRDKKKDTPPPPAFDPDAYLKGN